MPLKSWNTGTNKLDDVDIDPPAATRAEVRSAVYCPQNRWGTIDFGIDSKVGFAHVKEGAKGQLAGLKTMLKTIHDHKSADKVNAFACGSVVNTNSAVRFRSNIQSAVQNAGIRNFGTLFDISSVFRCKLLARHSRSAANSEGHG